MTAFPANATSYQDTALSAGSVTDGTYAGSNLTVTNGTATIAVSGSGVSTWALHGTPPSGVVISSTTSGKATISYQGSAVSNPPAIVADATDGNGNAEALVISVVIASNSIQKTGTPTVVKVTNLIDTNNSNGTVTFSATTSTSSLSYAESNLPTGLTSGNPLTYSGGTAAPGTYNGVKAAATDGDGAVLTGTFTLTVHATTVTTSGYGDYVNKFGNGFDSFRQHQYPGALIAGWPATQADSATHFILNNGTHTGAVQIEYAPGGTGSGLCVSDPGGGWGSDPLRDGLILADCNTGPFQQFIRQSDGTLKNLATGLYVNPDGRGAQLRGEFSATSWGGSSYTWKTGSSLP